MGTAIILKDGYYYWWPSKQEDVFDSQTLQAVTDILEELNANPNKQIKNDPKIGGKGYPEGLKPWMQYNEQTNIKRTESLNS